MSKKQELIILTGAPPAGKTTWGRAWAAKDPQHRVWIAGDEAAVKVAYEEDKLSVAFETNDREWSAGLRRRVTKVMLFKANKRRRWWQIWKKR